MVASVLVAGCASDRGADEGMLDMVGRGDFGRARARAIELAPEDVNARHYMLGRERYALLALADGIPEAAHATFDQMYDFLRTQGINKGTEGSAVLFGESNARTWKGEPYEQAMAYAYVAAHDALEGDWGNARAAADNALFLVRDFSGAIERGREAAGEEVSDQEAVIADAASREDGEFQFKLAPSDFELGYVLRAIAEDQLGEVQSRDETLHDMLALAPRLQPIADQVKDGAYNAVIMVDYGLGPERYAGGMDGVVAMSRARTVSGDEMLVASAESGVAISFPVVTDVNRLSEDVRWNGLEGMRKAKSTIGNALLVGGGVTAVASDDDAVQVAGLAAVLGGLLLKSGSGADTTHLEVLPQRTYVALLMLRPEGEGVVFEIPGRGKLALARIPGAPAGSPATFHYIRIPRGPGSWAGSAEILYANDSTGDLGVPKLPWILGGRCVRTPTYALMQEYYAAGLPESVTLDDLLAAYREEGIEIVADGGGAGPVGRHILEGGRFLYSPRPGSAGFARLFGEDHGAYIPSGAAARAIFDAMGANAVAGPAGSAREQ